MLRLLLDEKFQFDFVICRFFNEFLMSNERTIAREVRDEYVETMSKIYYSYFKSYTSRLMKLQVSVAENLTCVMIFTVDFYMVANSRVESKLKKNVLLFVNYLLF